MLYYVHVSWICNELSNLTLSLAFQRKAIIAELEKERRRLIQTSQSMNTPGARYWKSQEIFYFHMKEIFFFFSNVALFSYSISLSRPMKEFRDNAEQQHFAAQQKAALQHAHTHSTGFFITQDSSFGNLILPVIPRLEPHS
ncbi:hypothetical protein NL108_006126 [Boleophthalmus pectinirostris]|nr:hypothetical protein NL108_006126 [Boleophthalmus pectinirostris]